MKNASTKRLLAIAIPTWNRAAYLKELLEELTTQINQFHLENEVEILISDNHSEDGTENLAGVFTRSFSYVSYNRNSSNIGAKSNLIKSLELTNSEFGMVLGDDDRIRKDCLVEILKLIKSGENVGVLIDKSFSKNKNKVSTGSISLNSLLEYFYWYIGNAGLFITRTDFVKEARERFEYDFFNECWPQSQIMIMGLSKYENLTAYVEDLNIVSGTHHTDVMMYNSFYLWKTTCYELLNAIEVLKKIVDPDTYHAARKYIKNNIGQILFNVLQCGIFIDGKELREKTKEHIKKNLNLFSPYEKIFLKIIIIALSLPNFLARFLSDIFIFILKGRKGLIKKNDFVRSERIKKEKAQNLKFNEIRRLEFEKDNY